MSNTHVTAVQQAVEAALIEAREAVRASSYGVGGLLVHAVTGEIIYQMHNRVIDNKHLSDPTAHGERQLVDWYFSQVHNGAKLPPPKDIIVVTTLDPCYMCTGSILAAGFKAVVGALDDNAGINWNKSNEFKPLEGKLKEQLLNSFSYPEVPGESDVSRAAFGEVPDVFKDKTLDENTVRDCFNVFIEGANQARDIVNGDEVVPEDALNPGTLPQADEIIVKLKGVYPDALSYRAPEPNRPDIGLAQYLEKACIEDRNNGGEGEAAAFLDCFGNLLLCRSGNRNVSPILSPYMQLIRDYAKLRHDLGSEGRHYLCEPKHGTFVLYKGFDKSAASFADMGAYGSTILGELKNQKNLQYIVPAIPHDELLAYIKGMAERYSNVIKPMLVEDEALAAFRIGPFAS